jgi:hypothetical protein
MVAEGSPLADTMSAGMDLVSGVMGGIGDGIDAIFQVISKMMNAIIDASPMLQGVLKIVDKMFKLILMPIGNIIAKMLLPVAIKMANKTMAFLSKYGNAGPDKLTDMMSEGMGIALDSMIEMMSIVLNKVMPPLLIGLAKAIGSMLMGGNPSDAFSAGAGVTTSSDDLKTLLGGAAAGTATVINQFGMTVQTSNAMVGTSQTELAIAFYQGSVDIANGFQSVHDVLVIGTTDLMERFKTEFNGANAGTYHEIDTQKMKYQDLITILDPFHILPPPDVKGKDDGAVAQKNFDWWGFVGGVALIAAGTVVATVGNVVAPGAGAVIGTTMILGGGTLAGNAIANGGNMAKGGIATRPTRATIGEAGPEAVIPLDKYNMGRDNISISVNGKRYGKDEFNRKIEQAVNKYGTKVRGAY